MTATEAPFYADVADAPDSGACRWLTTADGLRLRAGFWREGARGTVLLFPGRTEYVEKYGPAAREFQARGYAMATIDWRGQGLSARLSGDVALGHIEHFGDFQTDVAALLTMARAEKLPEPYYLLAHSMGGQIGLRSLIDGLPVRAAVFSAPMWGIKVHPALRPLAWALGGLGSAMGQGQHFAPGTSASSYVLEAGFTDNVLTRDADMYAFMYRQITHHPDLSLGGPSLQWVYEALRDCLALSHAPSPDVPCLTVFGALERVVDSDRIRHRMASWPGGVLDVVPNAEHEVMMEAPAIRQHFYDRASALFASHG